MMKINIRKFFRSERAFHILKSEIPTNEKIINWGGKAGNTRLWQLFEDKDSYFFKLKLNDKETKSFKNMAQSFHKEEKVPSNTFRCFQCGYLYPLTVLNKMFILPKPPKWSNNHVQPKCKICANKD